MPGCSVDVHALVGAQRASSIPRSTRCSSTRSSRACCRRTDGTGSTRGWSTAGSAPTTCPAESSPGGGRRPAAERCSCPTDSRCGRRRRGWKLVVADAAQLEPRILAAMSGDRGMVEAGARRATCTRASSRAAPSKTRDQAKVGDARRDVRRNHGRERADAAAPAARLPASDRHRRGGGARGGARRDREHLARPQLAVPARRGTRRSETRPGRREAGFSRTRASAPAAGVGSRATSSCRAPPRSGRCAGWRRCGCS